MAVIVAAYIFIIVVAGCGWIMNLFDVAGINFSDPLTGETLLHLVGIVVFPLGAFMGIFF